MELGEVKRDRIAVLTRVLTKLSDEALEYVWRPILYAYYWTDQHGPDIMTEDDLNRIHLLGRIAHGSPELLARVFKHSHAIESVMEGRS